MHFCAFIVHAIIPKSRVPLILCEGLAPNKKSCTLAYYTASIVSVRLSNQLLNTSAQ